MHLNTMVVKRKDGIFYKFAIIMNKFYNFIYNL